MYDRGLATRLDELTATLFGLEETRMFGGVTYLMNGYICFASWDDDLVIRIGNESASKLVEDYTHARLFDLNGKTMKGGGWLPMRLARMKFYRIISIWRCYTSAHCHQKS